MFLGCMAASSSLIYTLLSRSHGPAAGGRAVCVHLVLLFRHVHARAASLSLSISLTLLRPLSEGVLPVCVYINVYVLGWAASLSPQRCIPRWSFYFSATVCGRGSLAERFFFLLLFLLLLLSIVCVCVYIYVYIGGRELASIYMHREHLWYLNDCSKGREVYRNGLRNARVNLLVNSLRRVFCIF